MIRALSRTRGKLTLLVAVTLAVTLVSFISVPFFPIARASGQTSSVIPPEITQYANDWPLPNMDYANTRATMSSAINAANVDNLGVAWAVPLPGQGIFGSASTMPVIMGDTAYFQDLGNNIFAVDMETGAIKWQTFYNQTNIGPNGIAVGYGKVFGSYDPYNIVALDMATGEEIWRTQVSEQPTTGVDIQPSVYDNLVYISTVPGTSGGDFYAGGATGSILALDESTGDIVWAFDTVDSVDIWGNKDINSGGGAWYPPAIDTDTGTTFWGIGNPAPWPGTEDFPNGSSRPGDNLYTNSMVALDAASGALQWYNQARPHDLFDLDFQSPPVLASASINGQDRDIVIGSGKLGKVIAYDRATGDMLWQRNVGQHQNDNIAQVPAEGVRVYPGFYGGVETPMAYARGIIYVPVANLYADYTPTSVTAQPFNEGTGELVAIDAGTGAILWSNTFDSLCFGGATVINDLVFTSTFDGMVYAFRADNGQQVWSYQAPGPVNAWPSAASDTILLPVGLASPFPVMMALKLGASAPTVAMLPLDGQSIETGNVTVSAMAFNITLVEKLGDTLVDGEGHLHYFMDVDAPTTPGQPAVPSTGAYAATANTTHTFTDVAPGIHTFSVELVNNDHTPLSTPVVVKATVTVTPPMPEITITAPEPRSSVTPGDITIAVDVSNFNLVDNIGENNADGEGHIIYYMDAVPPTAPGLPATVGAVTSVATIDTSYTWTNVPAGTHTFSVQLVNNDQTPLGPPVIAKIVVGVDVGASGGGP